MVDGFQVREIVVFEHDSLPREFFDGALDVGDGEISDVLVGRRRWPSCERKYGSVVSEFEIAMRVVGELQNAYALQPSSI